jgi:hypothetical protein
VDGKAQDHFSEEEVKDVLVALGVEQGYANPGVSGIKLVKRVDQPYREGYRCRYSCFFSTVKRGGCKFAIRATYRKKENDYQFHVGNEVHGEHIENPSVMGRQLLTSPSKLELTPGEFERSFAGKMTATCHSVQEKATEGFKRTKYRESRQGLIPGVHLRSRAAVEATLQQYLYSTLSQSSDFTDDTAFLCQNRRGDSYLLDDGDDNSVPRLVAVFATEELLLNLYRQFMSGQGIHIQLDASYRYTTERKLGYIPVKVSSLTQTGRSVAKAVVTREDSEVHAFIVESVKVSMEHVVNRRCRRGDKII